MIAHPVPNREAKTIAEKEVIKFILKYSIFKTLKSNNGTELKNEIMKQIYNLLNINQIFSTAYHHEILASYERTE